MAQQRKGLIYRLTMGKDNLPDFTPNRLPGTRWAVFKDVFFNRFGAIVKVSLLTLLFLLPLIAWIIIMYLVRRVDASVLPYSANLGLGYAVTPDVSLIAAYRNYMYNFQTYLIMIPLIMIAGLGFAGAFHVMKLLGWGEGVAVGSNFFVGIKRNWGTFLWIFLALGTSFFVMMFSFFARTIPTQMPAAVMVIMNVLAVVQFVLMLNIVLFAATQAVTYKLGFFALVKNSMLFTIALFPITTFFIVLSVLPVVIILIIPLQIAMFLWIIYALIGVGYLVLVWTVYSQWAFDKYVNDRVKGAVKNKGMYVHDPEAERAAEIERIKTRNTAYGAAYVSKRLSSLDDGRGFTPLETNFNRNDLARLNEEKTQMREEIEAERAELTAALEAEQKAFEEEQKKRKGKKGKKANGGQNGGQNVANESNAPAAGKKRKRSRRPTETDIAILPVTEEEYVDPDESNTADKN